MLKKIALLLLLTHSLFAQNSTLFELSKPGMEHKSYLFGTIHLSNDEVFNFSDSLFHFIDHSNQVLFELDMNNESLSSDAIKMSLLQNFSSIDTAQIKQFFKKLLPKIERKVPANFLAKRINEELLPALRRDIQLFMNQMGKRGLPMDKFLAEYAQNAGKETGGIETVDEQLSALLTNVNNINDMFTKKARKTVIKYLKKGNFNNPFDKYLSSQKDLIDTYNAFNLNKIETLLKTSMNEPLYDNLILRRNDIMFERTKELVNTRATFIAVGSGHLVGNNGLIQQYKDAGYSIGPVDLKTEFKREAEWLWYENEYLRMEVPEDMKDFILTEDEDYELINNPKAAVGGNTYSINGKINLQISRSNEDDYIVEEEPEDESSYEFQNDDYYTVDSASVVSDEDYFVVDSVAAVLEESEDMDDSWPSDLTYDSLEENSNEIDSVSTVWDQEYYEIDTVEAVIDEVIPSEYERTYKEKEKEKKSEAKTYFKELIENIDFMEFVGEILSSVKPELALPTGEITLNEIMEIAGEEVEINDETIIGQRTISMDLEKGTSVYSIEISGDSKAFDSFDWQRLLKSISLK
jgi:uncharacterized protein